MSLPSWQVAVQSYDPREDPRDLIALLFNEIFIGHLDSQQVVERSPNRIVHALYKVDMAGHFLTQALYAFDALFNIIHTLSKLTFSK